MAYIRLMGFATLLGAVGLTASRSAAQTVDWSNAADGVWSMATNWSPVGVPNSANADVRIGGIGALSITCDISPVVRSIDVSNASANLTVGNGQLLRVGSGGLMVTGRVEVNTGSGGGSHTYLDLDNGATITGPGPIVLRQGSNGSATARIGTSGTSAATIASNAVIQGQGMLYGVLFNQGTIAGGQGNGPEIRGVVNQQGSGKVIAGEINGIGQAVTLHIGGVLNGGVIETSGTGVVQATGDAVVNGVTTNGLLRVANDGVLNIGADGLTISTTGRVEVNTGSGGGSHTFLDLENGATITGPGPVVLRQGSNGSATARVGTSGANAASIAPNAVIQGQGMLYGVLFNQGTISGGLGNGPEIRGIVNQQGAGRVVAGEINGIGQFVTLHVGGVLNGGVIETSGTGVVQGTGDAVVNGVTTNGLLRVANDGVLNVGADGLTIGATGRVEVNTGSGGGSHTFLDLENGATITGPGPIVLRQGSNGSATARMGTSGANAATIAPNAVIQGQGMLYGVLFNRGTIAGGQGNGPEIRGIVNQQGSGKVIAGEINGIGQAVTLHVGGVLNGGVIETSGTGVVQGTGDAVVNGVTTNGLLRVANDGVLNVGADGLTIGATGRVEVNTGAGGGSHTFLDLENGATIAGPGPIVLRQGSNGSATARIGTSGSNSASIAANGSIQGQGQIYGLLTLHGTLSPGGSDAIGRIDVFATPLTLSSTATTAIDLGGPVATQRDSIAVGGSAILQCGGTVRVRFINGYRGAPCLSYAFVSGGTITGQFAGVELPATFPGWATLTQTSNAVTLHYRAADYDRSGDVAVGDIFVFLVDYFSATPRGDFNGLGGVTVGDIFDFLSAYFAGC